MNPNKGAIKVEVDRILAKALFLWKIVLYENF